MHDRRITTCDVEYLEIAAEVIAIGDQIGLRGGRDAHVAERASLHDGVIVRAYEQTDVHRIRKRYAGDLLRDEGVTESRDRHDVDTIAPLQLDHGVCVRQAVAGLLLLRRRSGRPAELKRHESVAVQRRRHVYAVGLEGRANSPTDLPMCLDSRADEAC